MKSLILSILLIAGCSSEEPSVTKQDDHAALQAMYSQKLAGFTLGGKLDCDNALWAGIAAAGGYSVDLSEYLYPNNQPQRRPKTPCYPNDLNGDGQPDSRSTISNDMLIGLGYGSWYQKDLVAKRIMAFAIANNDIMGEPLQRLGEVIFKYNVKNVYKRSLDQSALPNVYVYQKQDYQKHIQVLLMLWDSEVTRSISSSELDKIKKYSDEYPDDVLFLTAKSIYSGTMNVAITKLLSGTNPSSYVRGDKSYATANWLLAARLALKYSKETSWARYQYK